jgi:catechol 2,3-dioxygenase-like lactoylglutathione lyase family enzyme
MAVQRIKPNIRSDRFDESRAFYNGVIGLEGGDGSEIVYPLTDEDWGLRRFFVRDPNGAVINVTEHR